MSNMVLPIDVVDNRRLPPAHVWPPRRPVRFVRGTALTLTEAELEADRILARETEVRRAARQLDALFGSADDDEVQEVPPPEPKRKRALEEEAEDPRESMASFYASLKREQPVRTLAERLSMPNTNAVAGPSRPKLAAPLYSFAAPRQGSDWFIRKAEANFKASSVPSDVAGPSTATSQAVLPISLSEASQICTICKLPFGPLGARAHYGSIGHQLALDSSRPEIAPAVKAITASNAAKRALEKERLELDRRNVGWRWLEKMGWREGMGLGRREWEMAANGLISFAKEEPTGESLDDAIDLSEEEPSGRTVDEAIPLADSDEEEEAENAGGAQEAGVERARRVPILPVQHPGRRGIGAVSSRSLESTRQRALPASGSGTKRVAVQGLANLPRKLSKAQKRARHKLKKN